MFMVANWTLLTSRARALPCIAHDPEVRVRDFAASRASPNAAPTAPSPTRPRPATRSNRRTDAATATRPGHTCRCRNPATDDEQGNYQYPEGFDPEADKRLPDYETQPDEWERQYADAQVRYEAHRR
jgi:hypothetical protein